MKPEENEDTFSSFLLEDIKQRLLQAFQGQTTGVAITPVLSRPVEDTGHGRAVPTQDLHSSYIEKGIAWLRIELLEMKFQNQKLARTLLDISMEIQRLRNEIDISAALESKGLSIFGNSD
ncbi:alanine and arginine-rich domain-containing protein [Protobothrops mucrosquamatus]|uniref:alanine and arginine-rich domain-containing protein n=1 Tax=Protobothrops mucrosquamatus TaxID=103944 RepID=UPI0010FACFC7|nr:alanine and arginine-rich domain-containing protein [Protobothrops mucrosquamatus]